MSRIFISYSRADEPFARRLAATLSDAGADVWIDVEDIPAGMKWSSAIQEGLDSSDALLVVVSPEAMASRNVEDEWQYFLDRKRTVITLHYRPAKMHYQLHRIQYVDFHGQSFEVAYGRLLAELSRAGITDLRPPLPDDPTDAPTVKRPPSRPTRPAATRPVLIAAGGAPASSLASNTLHTRPSSKPRAVRTAPPPSQSRIDRLMQTPPRVRRWGAWWKHWGTWVALGLLLLMLLESILPAFQGR